MHDPLRRLVRGVLARLGARPHSRFSGAYPDWETARRDSDGWDSPAVLDKVRAGVLDVLQGRSAYERDGTSFAALPRADTLRRLLSRLATADSWIIDFGGGLGGTWINNRDILPPGVRFTVIEQPSFCEAGRRIAADHGLPVQFSTSVEALGEQGKPDVVIFSGVLSYVEDWERIVAAVLRLEPANIVVDRQILTAEDGYVCTQRVTGYYARPVSYPLRVFNEERFVAAFAGYGIRQRWVSDFDPPDHLGFHFVKAANGR
ncbi:MAG: methyltransferase, TIGR04325 family [Chromatiales bacterium]|nr:methyltransferase, TIGR04325 family [Chromatiales bacterium]